MSNPIRMTRDQLVEALEARRPWATALDRERLREHREAERAWVDMVKKRAREIVKLPAAELRKRAKDYRSLDLNRDGSPTCPDSFVLKLDRALGVLTMTNQQTFTIDSEGPWRNVYFLLTHDETAPASMC